MQALKENWPAESEAQFQHLTFQKAQISQWQVRYLSKKHDLHFPVQCGSMGSAEDTSTHFRTFVLQGRTQSLTQPDSQTSPLSAPCQLLKAEVLTVTPTWTQEENWQLPATHKCHSWFHYISTACTGRKARCLRLPEAGHLLYLVRGLLYITAQFLHSAGCGHHRKKKDSCKANYRVKTIFKSITTFHRQWNTERHVKKTG